MHSTQRKRNWLVVLGLVFLALVASLTSGVFAFLLLVLVLLLWVAPIVVIVLVAESRNRSKHYGWWGVGLGWVGAIIALILIVVQRENPPLDHEPVGPVRDAFSRDD